MKFFKSKTFIFLVILVIAVIILLPPDETKPPVPPPDQKELDEWAKVRAKDIPQVASGWGNPVYLDVSNLGWFESIHVSNDGDEIYLFHYPGEKDFFKLRLLGGPFENDIETHVSKYPFTTHEKLDKYYLSNPPYSSSGASTDADGNFFYSSNREGREGGMFPGEYDNQTIFRNDVPLAFNSRDENADNPFYCKERDELWYDCATDQLICVLRNAKKNDFSGKPILAPKPINFRTEKAPYFATGLTDFVNAQPWLTPDCNTIYWTSNRGRPSEGPWIYRSNRLDELGDKWSNPEIIIKSKIAVGEPTMPADGSKLFFVQFVMNENIDPKTQHGDIRTALYYIEKK